MDRLWDDRTFQVCLEHAAKLRQESSDCSIMTLYDPGDD